MLFPAESLARNTRSSHWLVLVVPIPWFVMLHDTVIGRPLSPAAGAVTDETTMSANGIFSTSNRLPASAVLFVSEPFSKTTLVASVRTKRWNRPTRAPGNVTVRDSL